jgi:hypothetical protein
MRGTEASPPKGIYIDLAKPVVLSDKETFRFVQCDLSIASPWFVDSRTTMLGAGEWFQIAGVDDVASRARPILLGAAMLISASFSMTATRTYGSDVQTLALSCQMAPTQVYDMLWSSAMVIH